MNILAVGDVVGSIGCDFLIKKLPQVKKQYDIDLTIVNAENSAERNGINKESMKSVFDGGADIITTGNHAFRNNKIYPYFDNEPYLIRPANFPKNAPGTGYCIFDMLKYRVCVINLLGVVYLESLNCPFATADKILRKVEKETDILIVDFHAEATGEKAALAYYLDGRVSAVFGTHTHVQTSDEKILPNGTGFITDVGMTGPIDSILGVKKENIIRKMKDKLPTFFTHADGKCHMDCAVFNIDENNGKCRSIKRLSII